jgi:hypothetical protein
VEVKVEAELVKTEEKVAHVVHAQGSPEDSGTTKMLRKKNTIFKKKTL